MRFLLSAAAAVALMSFATVSFAEEQAAPAPADGQAAAQQPAEATAEQPPAEDPDEVICKKLPAETGTRLGKRKECHTRKEWDQIADEARQATEEAQTKN